MIKDKGCINIINWIDEVLLNVFRNIDDSVILGDTAYIQIPNIGFVSVERESYAPYLQRKLEIGIKLKEEFEDERQFRNLVETTFKNEMLSPVRLRIKNRHEEKRQKRNDAKAQKRKETRRLHSTN